MVDESSKYFIFTAIEPQSVRGHSHSDKEGLAEEVTCIAFIILLTEKGTIADGQAEVLQ